VRRAETCWSGPHSDEAEPAVCRAYRGVSFIRHTACAGLLPLRARSRASCAPTPLAEAAVRRAETCWSGSHSNEAEPAVCRAYRGVSFIRHTACAGFTAAARQIASKLRSYAFGRSGIAACTNLLEAWSGPHSDDAEHAVCRAYRGVSFIRPTACAGCCRCAPDREQAALLRLRQKRQCGVHKPVGLGRIRTKLSMRCVGHTEE